MKNDIDGSAPLLAQAREVVDRYGYREVFARGLRLVADRLSPYDDRAFLDMARLIDDSAPTIVDAGAADGISTEKFLRRFPAATVHAFEPDERCRVETTPGRPTSRVPPSGPRRSSPRRSPRRVT